jgi:predicted RNA-binding protein with PUA-like domain
MSYWLLKSEPEVFSFADLQAAAKKTTHWDGVRNYQARNTLRDAMKKGDRCFFYHSNAEPSGIAGICEVVREGYPKSMPDAPTWYMVDVKAVRAFPRLISLAELRAARALQGMVLLQKGSRLSVQPVTPKEWETICALAGVAG